MVLHETAEHPNGNGDLFFDQKPRSKFGNLVVKSAILACAIIPSDDKSFNSPFWRQDEGKYPNGDIDKPMINKTLRSKPRK